MNELRIDVADLLTHPAARRGVRISAVVDGLSGGVAEIRGPVDVDLLLERVPDGIVARGTLRARYTTECGTCLRPLSADLAVEVSELFEDRPVDGETYPLEGHVVGLEQLARDALLLELPLAPTCPPGDPACVAETDPHAGDDARADADAGPSADPRWAALSTLEL
ncbi:MAG: YceD family protein [Acidimicrobiia bacterium]